MGRQEPYGIRIENVTQAWLTDLLSRIADHKINKVDQLMSWRYAQV
jgi:hypothetical protein